MVDLSQSNEDYLEAVLVIGLEQGIVRMRDLAKYLQVKAPSVATAIKKLADEGLVQHESYGHVELTSHGFELAQEIHNRHKLMFRFLHVFLGIDEATAEKDACEMEHGLSSQTINRIIKFLEFMEAFPTEGEPGWLMAFRHFIETGKLPDTCMHTGKHIALNPQHVASEKRQDEKSTGKAGTPMTLTDLTTGQEAQVLRINGGAELKRHLLKMGIVPGTKISMRDVNPQGDSIDIVVRGYLLSLQKEEAARITINPPG